MPKEILIPITITLVGGTIPNFSYKNNNALLPPNQTPLGFQRPVGQQAATYPPKKSNLDLMMEKFLNQNINSYK
jgi:hypothetical protein